MCTFVGTQLHTLSSNPILGKLWGERDRDRDRDRERQRQRQTETDRERERCELVVEFLPMFVKTSFTASLLGDF